MSKQPNFGSYIFRVLKQVNSDTSISSSAKYTINEITKSLIVDITNCAANLALNANKKTITARELQAATRILLPPQLSTHAISNGIKAVAKYNDQIEGLALIAGRPKSRVATLAGLKFSPSRVRALMRMHSSIGRIGVSAAVYLAAVVEYLVAELLEVSGTYAQGSNRVRIINRDVFLTVSNSKDLVELFSSKKYLLGGGVKPTLAKSVKNGDLSDQVRIGTSGVVL
jgi:histone H2B